METKREFTKAPQEMASLPVFIMKTLLDKVVKGFTVIGWAVITPCSNTTGHLWLIRLLGRYPAKQSRQNPQQPPAPRWANEYQLQCALVQ